VNNSEAIIMDVDGTLVDTNYHHALAWFRAFRKHGLILPLWHLHRHMGMGGDQLVTVVSGGDVEERLGEAIRGAQSEYYGQLIDEVEPIAGARRLLADLQAAGRTTVLASSAREEELHHYLNLLGARHLVETWTDASDVEATKPQPDLIHAALSKAGRTSGVMVGDSVFDCQAARRAGMETIAVLTGGFSREELQEAGASQVCGSMEELRDALDLSPVPSGTAAR
jgi:HAD superfamily hydrolase (TIGR01509 family)